MRQHILRLIIVLALVVGGFFIVSFFIKDSTPLNITTYVENNIQKDKDLKDNINSLGSDVNSLFTEDVIVFNSLEDISQFYAASLTNVKLDKDEVQKLKKLYNDYRKEVENLVFSTNSLIRYMALDNISNAELLGRKQRVNTDFNALNKSYVLVVEELENLLLTKIYGGDSFNSACVLKSTYTLILNAYNQTRNNFNFVNDVRNKISAFENSFKPSDTTIKLCIKYNNLERATLKQDFVAYFTSSTTNEDLQIILNCLNSGVYYE